MQNNINHKSQQSIAVNVSKSNDYGMTAMMHLSKIRIGAAITVTAAFGYMMATGSLGLEMVLPLLGTLILATGASALNQYQEYDYDKLMPRTMNRPIPRGDLSPRTVLFFALFTILAGLGILALSPYGEGWPLVLGMLSVVSYNAVYTPLKRKTALAIVPGSIVGALPPAIGYTAGGGDPFAMDILYVGFFLFIWQIPHFWMLLLKYDKEYQSAGFPVLTEKVSKDQLFVMIFIWTLSLVGLGLVMPIFGLGLTLPAFIFNVSISIWMVVKSIGYFKTGVEKVDGKKWFLSLNIYVILLLFAMAMERVYLNF